MNQNRKMIMAIMLFSVLMLLGSLSLKAQIAQIPIKGCDRPCNLVRNGNFEATTPGFTSDMLTTCADCATNCVKVVASFRGKCNSWPNTGSGSGNFLAVDGHTAGDGKDIWKQNIRGCKGITYTFSFRAANIYGATGAENVTFIVNNNPVPNNGVIVSGSPTVSVNNPTSLPWRTYTVTFTAYSDITSIALRQNSPSDYSDIGIDDIFFGFCTCACTQP